MTEKEIEDFLNIYGITRGKTDKDRLEWRLEKESLMEFLDSCNSVEGRLKYVKEWYRRKTSERTHRKNYPDGKFANSDKKIASLLIAEQTENAKKTLEVQLNDTWDNMTESSLRHQINRFKTFILNDKVGEKEIKVINAILLHPKLHIQDKEEIETLKRQYGIDKMAHDEFLFVKPIKIRGPAKKEISNEEWLRRLETASGNFISDLIHKIKNFN